MGNYKKIVKDGYILYQNNGGAEIGTAKNQIIEQDGYVFKNLAGEEKLLPYEDWRLSFEERANDLSERLSVHAVSYTHLDVYKRQMQKKSYRQRI